MINNDLFIFIIEILLFSLAIDLSIAEVPTIIHPVVIIGKLTDSFKKIFINIKNKASGVFVVILTVMSISLIFYIIYLISQFSSIILLIVLSLLLSTTYSINMLLKSALSVKNDLCESIDKARESVSYLVSRDTNELSEAFIVSAVVETLTENITDSYTAVIFYFIIASVIVLIFNLNVFYLILIPLIYRCINTQDAMLGYKTSELLNIGFFPAKADDFLNYIPSRLTGLFIVLSAFILRYDWRNSYMILKRDASMCPSPNSGYTMAPAAGALDIKLIKKDTYVLGDDLKEIETNDISKAVKLSALTIILFTITFILLFTLIWVIF